MRPDRIAATDRLAAWRAEHAERLDPLRFRFLEALARRTEAQQGKARELLEQKLSALLDAYAAALAAAPQSAGDADAEAAVRAMQPGPLGALLAQSRAAAVAIRAGNDHGADLEANDEAPTATDAIDTELPAPSPLPTAATAAARLTAPQLPAVEDARRLWTELRSRSQLRQSLQPAPADAGPLNSGVLVHRALALMRTLSPGYLQHFLSYVDALSWLQQLQEAGALATPQKSGSAAGKPATPRGKPRKRG
ncbi:DUF2894 domain-containing protein [Xanthomonas sacchari]|uniref:DUF2894 domain-containing protein n=1 Tax=Xanthomonas sacchari TaxID=56458 RepID=UPI002255B8EE|nr:DUF2894 domain-containing protein [Xanthomonas sacchari]MCW0411167.1 hypothetical protein [Xanthomonas sacchari]UYK67580.1 DUF2894 domain-containing protein [Xanthomonas sacchari]